MGFARGASSSPCARCWELSVNRETIEISSDPKTDPDHLEFDIVSHDVKKFFFLILKKNGYVLEQLYSPLIVHTRPEHEELKQIAKNCITRHHSYHYLRVLAQTQCKKLFAKENPRRAIEPLMYVFRVMLTGIHLMRTGVIMEANLLTLNDEFKLPFYIAGNGRATVGRDRSNRGCRKAIMRCTRRSIIGWMSR